MINNAFLLLNGEPPTNLSLLENSDLTVCADGAYNYARGYRVDAVVGDFDSISCQLPPTIVTRKFPRDKDFTDGELALEYILGFKPQNLTILGAGGGRADHQLANYRLLHLAKDKTNAVIDDGFFRIWLVSEAFCTNSSIGKIVSIAPFFGQVNILSTRGLKYAIDNRSFNIDTIVPICNETTDTQFSIEIDRGCALVFLEK